jgi:predicted HTH transcriptional regulator
MNIKYFMKKIERGNNCCMENYDKLILELLKLPKETEWVEFKHNNSKPDEIGEYISALSNSASYE